MTDHASFLECKDLYQQILRIKDALGAGVAVVLVGSASVVVCARPPSLSDRALTAAPWFLRAPV